MVASNGFNFTCELKAKRILFQAELFRKSVLARLCGLNGQGKSEGQNWSEVRLHPELVMAALNKIVIDHSELFKRHESKSALASELNFIGSSSVGVVPSWTEEAIAIQAAELSRSGAHTHPLRIGNVIGPSAVHEMTQAIQIIEGIWSEAALSIRVLVREVVWVRSPGFYSSSLPAAFGAVFVNPRSDWEIPDYLEAIVHEAAHLDLMIQQRMDPLLVNPGEMAESPLRKDPRPLIGILHSVFVLGRTTEMLKRYLDYNAGKRQKRRAADLLARFEGGLNQGLNVLRYKARPTDAGLSLIDSLERLDWRT